MVWPIEPIETHHHHRVCAHQPRVHHQAVDRVAAGVFHQRRIFLDLTADDRAQAGHDIAGRPRLRTTTPNTWPRLSTTS
jgi:hypothetical protein